MRALRDRRDPPARRGVRPQPGHLDHRRRGVPGREIPELYGRYLYADYVSGNVWAVGYDEDGAPTPELILTLSANPELVRDGR